MLTFGFSRYLQIVAITLLLSLLSMIVTIPMGLLGVSAMTVTGPTASIWIIVVIFLVLLAVVIFISIRVYFATMACVDPDGSYPGPIDSIKISWEMTRNHTFMLLCAAILGGLIAFASVILLVLPFIFYALPLITCVTGVAYALLADRYARMHADTCVHCGYPRGQSPVCTECGAPFREII